MRAREIGLRHRLRRALRQMEEQHRNLRPIHAELSRALEHGALSEIVAWLERYGKALDAHFSLEDELLFPALLGLDPGAEPELDSLSRDHGAFMAELHALQEELAAHFGRSAALRVASLRESLAEHESREEGLVSRILSIDAAD
jgi:hemerythrin-like domain-containing protein